MRGEGPIKRSQAENQILEEQQIKVFSPTQDFVINQDFKPRSFDLCETNACLKEARFTQAIKHFVPLKEKNEELFARLDTPYLLISKVYENYLVLFKASKNLEDLPFLEQSSLIKVDKVSLEETDKKEDVLYMVPFVGYKLKLCRLERQVNRYNQDIEDRRVSCDRENDILNQYSYDYIQIQDETAQYYDFKRERKHDLLPVSYLLHGEKGEQASWFHMNSSLTSDVFKDFFVDAEFIEFYWDKEELRGTVLSGGARESFRHHLPIMPSRKVDYKMNLSGNRFVSFSEEEDLDKKEEDLRFTLLEFSKGLGYKEGYKIENFGISQEAFYLDYLKEENQYRMFFLRKKPSQEKNFVVKRWFEEDNLEFFGFHHSSPKYSETLNTNTSLEADFEHHRIRQFNTRASKDTVIEYHLSQNSTKESFFVDLVQKAFQRWNRAFEIIKEDLGVLKTVTLKLNPKTKPLGDLRTHYVNLLYNESDYIDFYWQKVKLFNLSFAVPKEDYTYLSFPSVFNAETGQMLASTINVNINQLLKNFIHDIRMYIRFEIFKKDYKSKKEQEVHVISPYLIEKLQSCTDVQDFIALKKQDETKKVNEALQDTQYFSPCAKKISKDYLVYFLLNQIGSQLGLDYNYEASADEKNSYKSLFEMEERFKEEFEVLPKGSSVMDVLPYNQAPLTVPGKYDIAGLKLLYFDTVETHLGHQDVKPYFLNEEAFLSKVSDLKNYFYCPQEVNLYITKPATLKQNYLCQKGDYGFNLSEILDFYIQNFHQNNEKNKYRYDLDQDVLTRNKTDRSIFNTILSYLEVGQEVQQEHFSRNPSLLNYRLEDPKSLEEFSKVLTEGGKKIYQDFLPIQSQIMDLGMDLFFHFNMTCEIRKKGEKLSQFVNLFHTLHYINDPELFAENCFSPGVKDFFEKEGFTLLSQKGSETLHHKPGEHGGFYKLNEIEDGADLINHSGFYIPFENQGFQPIKLYPFENPMYAEKIKTKLLSLISQIPDPSHAGFIPFDITRIQTLYKAFRESTLNEKNLDILEKNQLQWSQLIYSTQTEAENSFNKVVISTIHSDRNIEDLPDYVQHLYLSFLLENLKKDLDSFKEWEKIHVSSSPSSFNEEQKEFLLNWKNHNLGEKESWEESQDFISYVHRLIKLREVPIALIDKSFLGEQQSLYVMPYGLEEEAPIISSLIKTYKKVQLRLEELNNKKNHSLDTTSLSFVEELEIRKLEDSLPLFFNILTHGEI